MATFLQNTSEFQTRLTAHITDAVCGHGDVRWMSRLAEPVVAVDRYRVSTRAGRSTVIQTNGSIRLDSQANAEETCLLSIEFLNCLDEIHKA